MSENFTEKYVVKSVLLVPISLNTVNTVNVN